MRENRQPLGEVEGHIPALRRYARGLMDHDHHDPAACADEMVRVPMTILKRAKPVQAS